MFKYQKGLVGEHNFHISSNILEKSRKSHPNLTGKKINGNVTNFAYSNNEEDLKEKTK
jgi:hypothetical protein